MSEKEIPVSPITKSGTDPTAYTSPTSSLNIQNHEFIAAIFQRMPPNAFAAVCTKPGNPETGGWLAQQFTETMRLLNEANHYLNSSSFCHSEDGDTVNVRKEQFAAIHFVMLDDLGTKIPIDRLGNFEPSWLIETSPGNFQAGIILDKPITDRLEAEHLVKSLIDAGLCDPGSSGISRWTRLPVGINGKPKYLDAAGKPFHCRLIKWNPDKRYAPKELSAQLNLNPTEEKHSRISEKSSLLEHSSDTLIPKSNENPVIAALKIRGLYKKPLGQGKHDISCPWLQEHTDALDTGAAYFEPDESYPLGGFCCQHSHRGKFHIRQVLDYLDIEDIAARHKPIIRIIPGDLHRVIDAAEKVLAENNRFYQSGGLIVTVVTDPATGNSSIVPISAPALMKELAADAIWMKFDGHAKQQVRCDPSMTYVNILYNAGEFKHMLPLNGIARQPYFRESDGVLVTLPGYDSTSKLFGVFDPNQFTIPIPTIEAARSALVLLEDLISEFRFASDIDKSAALSAIFTAVIRPTLPYAPAFHVKAPISGSGKTYLSELVGAFAGPADNAKVSYPTTSEEATKVILSLLLSNPAVIEFDDLDNDLIPHGVVKRVLTSEKITDRILGVSKTATVSTRTLFLSSGNNVGPVRDLLRRVITIHVDPLCAMPVTITYKNNPVEKVRRNREKYVSAVLTIIQAYRSAGSPRADVQNIATYSGPWSDYCRQPLIWLGLSDPAMTLIDQITRDPDTELLKDLMSEWNHLFSSKPMTVRKVVEYANNNGKDLLDAIRELPVFDRGEINPSKFGWFLKKNANRIIGDYKFQESTADGRKAWSLIYVPPNPPKPSVTMAAESTKSTEPDSQL